MDCRWIVQRNCSRFSYLQLHADHKVITWSQVFILLSTSKKTSYSSHAIKSSVQYSLINITWFMWSISFLEIRQLMEIVDGTFPVAYPNNECMCSLDQPTSVDESGNTDHNFCNKLISNNYQQFLSSRKLRTDVALPDNVRFFSSEYITDGRVGISCLFGHIPPRRLCFEITFLIISTNYQGLFALTDIYPIIEFRSVKVLTLCHWWLSLWRAEWVWDPFSLISG